MSKVNFKDEYCKGCKLCVSVCPKKILATDDKKINDRGFHPVKVIDIDKCIGCGFCAIVCPDCAVEVT